MRPAENLVLIGHRCAGKSSIAVELARDLNLTLQNVDRMILLNRHQYTSIQDLVSKTSWQHFRMLEENLCGSLVRQKNLLIDCGGGVVENPSVMQKLSQNNVLLWIQTSLSALLKRHHSAPNRPRIMPDIFVQEEINALYFRRNPLYKQYANLVINTDNKSIDHCVQEAVQLLTSKGVFHGRR